MLTERSKPHAHAFALKVETGADITAARRALGHRWGLGRDLTLGELGMLLRLKPANAWDTVGKWEDGTREPSGPVCVAIELMLAGAEPAHIADVMAPTRAATSPRGPHRSDRLSPGAARLLNDAFAEVIGRKG